jgi:hypothetical protein
MEDEEVLTLEVPAHVGAAEVLLGMGVGVNSAAVAAARAKQLAVLRRRKGLREQLLEGKRGSEGESETAAAASVMMMAATAVAPAAAAGGRGRGGREVEVDGAEEVVVNGAGGYGHGGEVVGGEVADDWMQCQRDGEQSEVSREFLLREEVTGVGASDTGDTRIGPSPFQLTPASAVTAAGTATTAATATPTAAAAADTAGADNGVTNTAVADTAPMSTAGDADGDNSEVVFSPGHFYRVANKAETYAPSNISVGSQMSWAAWSTTSSISRCPELQWWGKEGASFSGRRKGRPQRLGGVRGQQQGGQWVMNLFKRDVGKREAPAAMGDTSRVGVGPGGQAGY